MKSGDAPPSGKRAYAGKGMTAARLRERRNMARVAQGWDEPEDFFRWSDLSLVGATHRNKAVDHEFDCSGELAVAGVTNEISMPVFVRPLGNGKVRLSGQTFLKMTSFELDPPTKSIPLGAIKPADDVKLLFERKTL